MSSRARRRSPLRLACLVEREGQTLLAHSVDVAPDGLHVVVEGAAALASPPKVGDALSVRLLLAELPLVTPARLQWLDVEDRDAQGRRALGLGLELLDSEVLERLDQFVRDFRPPVLLVEPVPAELRAIASALGGDYRLARCSSGGEALAWLREHEAQAVVLGQRLGDMSCLEFVQALRPGAPGSLIVVYGSAAPELDELAAEGSIFYFLRRPVRPSQLQQAVRRGVEACALTLDNERLSVELERVNEKLARENLFLRRQVEVARGFEGLIGESALLKQALADLARVRDADTTVHVRGETGTGKELVARALHFSGPRASGPFLAVNCAGMPDSLLQSTLFGHRRGSFTGADRDHPGVFAEAQGGTLFLDEVAELSPAVQGALLRALEEGEVVPVGAARPVRVDVRLVSATHANLRERVQAGLFREDLYFRLVVVAVSLPPLRERREDLRLLARHFLTLHQQHLGRRLGAPTEAFFLAIEGYAWPGNVRELEHEIERLVVLADEGVPLSAELLSPHILSGTAHEERPALDARFVPKRASFDETVDAFMRELVDEALSRTHGNVSAAAEVLGVERSRLGKLRTRLGVGGRS